MIHFYYGPDAYRVREAAALALARARETTPEATVVFADAQTDEGRTEFERILKYPSLWRQASMVILQNVLADAETAAMVQQLLEDYTVHNAPDTLVVACHQGPGGRESAATKSLTGYLERHATTHERMDVLQSPALNAWITNFCSQRSGTIEPSALSLLAQRAGGDGWALSNELEKLCAYAGGEPISPAMVGALVPARPEADEFRLSNALASNNKRAAICALWERRMAGVAEQMLLGGLAYSIRTLLTIKDLADRGLAPGAIAKSAGLAPFVVTKSIRGAAAYDKASLLKAHAAIAALDRDSKSGRMDAEDGLYAIVLAL